MGPPGVDPNTSQTAAVLVVEDDAKLGDVLIRALSSCGVHADLAATGEGALAMAAGHSYSAVLIDRTLPGMDGRELCRRLRRVGPGAPAVIMSARDDLASRIGPAGADGYRVKPLPLDLLLSTLRYPPALSRRAGGRWGDAAPSAAR